MKHAILRGLAVFAPCLALAGGPPDGLAVDAGYAYAVYGCEAETARVEVVDISSRGVFRPVGALECRGVPAGPPVVYGDAFFLPLANRIEVMEITNPEQIEPVCHLATDEIGRLLAISPVRDGCLVASGTTGRLLYDVSDPFSPVLSGGTVSNGTKTARGLLCDFYANTNGPAFEPQAAAFDSRGFVVLACRADGIRVFSLGTNGAHQVTRLRTQGDARDVCVCDGLIWVADGTKGVGVYAMDECGLLTHIRHYPLLRGSASALLCGPDAVYATGEETLLCEIPRDVSRRRVPRILEREGGVEGNAAGVFALPRAAWPAGVAPGARLIAIDDGPGGVVVVDVSKPGEPVLVQRANGRRAAKEP